MFRAVDLLVGNLCELSISSEEEQLAQNNLSDVHNNNPQYRHTESKKKSVYELLETMYVTDHTALDFYHDWDHDIRQWHAYIECFDLKL